LIDFVIVRIVDALAKDIRADQACMQYLYRLKLVGKFIDMLRTSTRIRLQGTIYSLTQPGGPRYASRKVNRLAFSVLDILFPHGKRTRRMINFGFRFLFAQEWPWVWWDACCALFSSISVGLAYVLSVLVFVQQRILRWCRRRVSWHVTHIMIKELTTHVVWSSTYTIQRVFVSVHVLTTWDLPPRGSLLWYASYLSNTFFLMPFYAM
jgi:hypothetical protein